MVQIPLGTNDWESFEENIARVKMRNMYIAENPLSPDGMTRVSRPALKQLTTIGDGPIKGFWRQAGSLDDKWLIVSSTDLYAYDSFTNTSTLLGSVPGIEFAQFAGNEERAIVVRDGIAYETDGTSFSVITMPEPGQKVQTVAQIDGTFLLGVKDTFRFYWLEPGESTPDPLNFASAERFPDPIVSINIISDEIQIIGTDSIEVWQTNDDPDIPYTRIAGRVYTDGVQDRDTVIPAAFRGFPCLIWVTNNKEVVLMQGAPQRVSNDSIEELLRSATNLRAWTYRRNRCDFYILTSDTFTLAYNITNQQWSRFNSHGLDYWRAHLGLQVFQEVYAGDASGNVIWHLEEAAEDEEATPIVCQVRGFVPLTGNKMACSSVNVRSNAGWSTSYTTSPALELRWSDDYGFTWSEPLEVDMGVEGAYDTDLTFRSLGRISRPGRMFEISFSGLANYRIDYATMNEV